ncbi:unnamed protein product, partial [Oikopleura dioica]
GSRLEIAPCHICPISGPDFLPAIGRSCFLRVSSAKTGGLPHPTPLCLVPAAVTPLTGATSQPSS